MLFVAMNRQRAGGEVCSDEGRCRSVRLLWQKHETTKLRHGSSCRLTGIVGTFLPSQTEVVNCYCLSPPVKPPTPNSVTPALMSPSTSPASSGVGRVDDSSDPRLPRLGIVSFPSCSRRGRILDDAGIVRALTRLGTCGAAICDILF